MRSREKGSIERDTAKHFENYNEIQNELHNQAYNTAPANYWSNSQESLHEFRGARDFNSLKSYDSQQMREEYRRATLHDLCDEDKERIGKLMKLIATQKEEKLRLQNMMQDYIGQYERALYKLREENEIKTKESMMLEEKLKSTIDHLKQLEVLYSIISWRLRVLARQVRNSFMTRGQRRSRQLMREYFTLLKEEQKPLLQSFSE